MKSSLVPVAVILTVISTAVCFSPGKFSDEPCGPNSRKFHYYILLVFN